MNFRGIMINVKQVKPMTPDERHAKNREGAMAQGLKLMGVAPVVNPVAAPAPVAILSAKYGPFAGSQSSASSNVTGLKKLLWRT